MKGCILHGKVTFQDGKVPRPEWGEAMKEFAHPDQTEMVATDLNRALQEYKRVAEVEADLGALPRVVCHAGEINQVFLNVIVNAAHAIEEVVRGTSRKGRTRVSTRREGEEVVVSTSDTGGGIPDAIRERVFDPFFTT